MDHVRVREIAGQVVLGSTKRKSRVEGSRLGEWFSGPTYLRMTDADESGKQWQIWNIVSCNATENKAQC